ncbi:hypothetical protein BDV38DRAFT_273139 [Aspergillus pseudotamarii]|uniref:RING-type E3 ubiquitin transferase n=1 Tax=Aspergillus pseudotamarii TaxID=132259 RepID=A0A5N6SJQ0_ASPPS|nr:uncharacterized protein BDV38DRAFT_273139 [Aspergillus pseudotamarii]KAE8134916.1 hypothetical protein BDV38DRAFT_273139 [Aspergillus pseudotamarii]
MGPIQDPSVFPFSSSSLPLLLLLLVSALSTPILAVDSSGWSVVPSNNSRDLSWVGKARFHLESAQIQLPSGVSVTPLTTALVNLDRSELTNFNVTGNLVNVDDTNAISLNTSDIALISCDQSAYPGNLDASETVRNVITSSHRASAILLYSSEVHHCNYTAGPNANGYINVFTLVNPSLAKVVTNLSHSSTGNGSTSIKPDMSFTMSGTPPTSGDSGGATDSPNTGIITALFLAIIITGAVRAHRHPERYGPRYTAGRPRQSRTKGMARAMLDTIPIVKFGNQQDPKLDAVKGDVEMGSEDETGRQPDSTQETTTVHETNPQATPALAVTNHTTTESTTEQQTKPTESTDHPNFSCPICTDDFVKGQDLRVLPCNHQFHPECIDPWLVNVSGTCPLCRIDLNPAQPEGENENQEGENNTEAPQEGTAEPAAEESHHRHRRLTSYLHGTLNARRMREATVEERLAALRSVREENRNSIENEEEQQRRGRLTSRLRDRFRIRTRRHGDDGEQQPSASTST